MTAAAPGPGVPEAWPGAAGPPGSDPDALDAELRERVARTLAERAGAVAADPWRQAFHVQPPVGLLNDPNGLVQHEGTYHLCYQWHPFAPAHALKHWAHLTSRDLVHWEAQPMALAPSQPYETHGCYSGSGVVHDGAVHFLYTGNVRTPDGGRTPFQNLATLAPSRGEVVKHPANPLVGALPGCGPHVRDPKAWVDDGGCWMVLGAQTEDLHGTVLLLHSPDLVTWEFLGQIAGGAGDPFGYMWECPDLLRFGDRDVLVISPQFDHGEAAGPNRYEDVAMYATGRLAGDPPRFARDSPFRRLDAGPDFYAPQSFVAEDGRTIMIGWMGMPDHPGQPSLAEKHPSAGNGWVHCLTVPREVHLDGDALVQVPVRELAALRGAPVAVPGATIGTGERASVPGLEGTALDLELTVACPAGGRLEVRLRDGDTDRPAVLTVDPGAGVATLDRSQLGTGEGGATTGTFRAGPQVDARILLDHSSVEVFLDGGRLAMSARLYPLEEDTDVSFAAVGAPATLDGTGWPMAPA
ncbi:MAG: glycoside hydrolase family 32 protein [Candidatus Nanopelagicales bacterium]|nr:glycoside hydrolase family 32 protein [Candidatus Nanopelagicales bacterium]